MFDPSLITIHYCATFGLEVRKDNVIVTEPAILNTSCVAIVDLAIRVVVCLGVERAEAGVVYGTGSTSPTVVVHDNVYHEILSIHQ